MNIHEGNLVGADVEYIWSKKNKTPMEGYDNIIIHYTAGYDALSSAKYLANDTTNVSAHVVISRDGKIYQMVDFGTQAWHTGRSQFKSKLHLNRYSIGIELENYGPLTIHEGKYITCFNKEVPEEEVVEMMHPLTRQNCFWQIFPQEQLYKLKELCKLLMKTYKCDRILGHNEISLTGKIDPGPAFPMDQFKKFIYTHRYR